jgi:phage gp29-like protein
MLKAVLQPEAQSLISQERIERAIQFRYSPFPELSMELLAQQLNQFRVGELRPAARTWEIMLERDGELSGPAQKRFADTARLPWQIEKDDDSPEAERHAEALNYFYTNLTATSALEQDQLGDVNLLVQQIMTAHAHRYSVHEMLWQVNSAGRKQVTGIFRHCPVWLFEAHKGRLAFLKSEGDYHGELLERGHWLPAVGHGHMRPCSIAYAVKHFPLRDWLLFSSRFGMPGIQGLTDAQQGSDDWNNFAAALQNFANDWITITNRGAEIKLIEAAKGASSLPFKDLVERGDRLYARLFRGGDLSTQSGDNERTGASLQDEEKMILLEDDAHWVSGACNVSIDEPLIEYLFATTPKAWWRLQVPKQPDSDREIKGMEFLVKHGGRVSIKTAHERLQIPQADQADELLTAPATPALQPAPEITPALANNQDSSLVLAALDELPDMRREWLAPLRAWFTSTETALQSDLLTDEEVLRLVDVRVAQLPELIKQLDLPAYANALEAALGSAVVNGLAEAVAIQGGPVLANSRRLALANAVEFFGTPKPLADAVAQLGGKTPVGSILRTRDWDRMPLALRQRGQFSAGVESVRLMQRIQDALKDNITLARNEARADGSSPGKFRMNRQKFIADMRDVAISEGLIPADPETHGTLQDITSEARLDLIWRTQIGQAQGYAHWKHGQSADILDAWPAQELVRNRSAKVPRDWQDRWVKAAESVGDTAALEAFRRAGRMVALKTSAIWVALSRFGTPYPPFDFNSGMGLKLIDREGAITLGVLAPDQELTPQVEDFNANLEASVSGLDDRFKGALRGLFGEQIEMSGDTVKWRAVT